VREKAPQVFSQGGLVLHLITIADDDRHRPAPSPHQVRY
jgi:hypothetical protein